MTHSRECDHTRVLAQRRSTAVTVCRACRDYLCSICGVTIDWYEGLCVTNPLVQWRYCAKTACVAVEAAYHGLSFDEIVRSMRLHHRQGRRRYSYVQAFLVGTGIEKQLGILDPAKIEALMQAMR